MAENLNTKPAWVRWATKETERVRGIIRREFPLFSACPIIVHRDCRHLPIDEVRPSNPPANDNRPEIWR